MSIERPRRVRRLSRDGLARDWRALLVTSLGLLLTAGIVSASAQVRGDAVSGRAIAERWCAACHMVSPDQPVASPDAPTFMAIARAAPDDLSTLEGFLADPHPPMPDMSLTREEITDLLAYIATLR